MCLGPKKKTALKNVLSPGGNDSLLFAIAKKIAVQEGAVDLAEVLQSREQLAEAHKNYVDMVKCLST